jgi:hypothetical protein
VQLLHQHSLYHVKHWHGIDLHQNIHFSDYIMTTYRNCNSTRPFWWKVQWCSRFANISLHKY